MCYGAQSGVACQKLLKRTYSEFFLLKKFGGGGDSAFKSSVRNHQGPLLAVQIGHHIRSYMFPFLFFYKTVNFIQCNYM